MILRKKRKRLHVMRRHLARLERRRQRLGALSRQYARARATVVLVGIVAMLLSNRAFGEGVGWSVGGGFVVAFVLLARHHNRVKHSLRRHLFWLRLKRTRVARMTLDWTHIPLPPVAPAVAQHPFASDLNLTGERSLHQLMDTSMSREGSARLRSWLLAPLTTPAQIRARQDLVRELIPLATFRDRLALQGAVVTQGLDERWDGEALRQWLERPAPPVAFIPWLLVLGLLAGTNLTLGLLYALALAPPFWIVTFVAYILLYYTRHAALGSLFAEAFHLEKTLHQFRTVLVYLETYPYGRAVALATLCAPFVQTATRPSVYLTKIARIAGAASVQQGNLVGPLVNALVPWDLYFAYRFIQCKAAVKLHLPVWLDTWYELEALNALADFGYANPDCVFPDVMARPEHAGAPVFSADQMGHPLLSDDGRVSNDFTLEHLGVIVMITGSNMAGKSTFLRTLGVNLCLAFSGAPVQAAALRTVPFRLFTCITVSDSVTDGMSYFYAEVRRLKALLEALREEHPCPLFFLIDEIFRGTNNRERHLGSRAYIQALTGGHGVGVVSTHDLELVHLADDITDIRNVHFREDVVDGHMVFDYTLRAGPCPTTNALTIMRLAGLPVP